MTRALAQPDLRARYEREGLAADPMASAAFQHYVVEETAKWGDMGRHGPQGRHHAGVAAATGDRVDTGRLAKRVAKANVTVA